MGGSMMSEAYENNIDAGLSSLAITNTSPYHNVPVQAPIISSYNDQIRPLLDTIDRLRNLNVMKEGIQLPTIVVVGDQSSGKSSVLESLAGISLPRDIGICTRVPLVMRLQRSSNPEPEIWLEYGGNKHVPTDEEHITKDICIATEAIAGAGKGVSDTPIELYVRSQSVPDLTMVDLPGITRNPVNGQPEDIYEQVSAMIKKHIEPQETIILNVLAAGNDFSTYESIRMSKQVDKKGERTLAVVTKADVQPQGLLQKVTADDVNIGLGYVCVRNRLGDETYQEAREKEEELFKTNPWLSKIDKSIIGIPVLAKRLVEIQATMITRCLPEIVKKIDEKLDKSVLELSNLPAVITCEREAWMTFTGIIRSVESLLKLLIIQGDLSQYPDDPNMRCSARLADMLIKFSSDLQFQVGTEFLMDEIKVLEESKSIGLPNFIPESALLAIIAQRVDAIRAKPVEFMREIWDYLEVVISSVINKSSENFSQIQPSIQRASRRLISKIKEHSVTRVIEMVEMEKMMEYTCNPEYTTVRTQKIASQANFVNAVTSNQGTYTLAGFGTFPITHLRKYPAQLLHRAFDLKMSITAYWPIVVRRIVDSVALHLQFTVKNLVNSQFQKEVAGELGGGGDVEKMLHESPSVASKRKKLKDSIKLLKESKEAVAGVLDQNLGHAYHY
ncbi:Dynamin central domain-containing protein [Hirschfeldia incana]|nr:Dynamin central domain-containing protein [Hirschfeldia incana]